MQLQTYKVVLFVIILETGFTFAQESESKHTFGPSISSDQTVLRLSTKIVGKIMLKRDVLIQATLPEEGSGSIRSCLWTSPSGIEYHVDQASIVNLGGKFILIAQ